MTARLLIIDDDQDIRESLVSLLGTEGYETVAANGGKEALALLATPGYRPDAILLDLLMPSMNGVVFAGEVARHPEWSRIPIIVCTAGSVPPEIAPRVFGVLQKPFDFDRLLELLDDACKTA